MIIGTSLAPSPTAIVIHCPLFFASYTTSAFCFGETRHKTTELARTPSLINTVARTSSLKTWFKVEPSITNVILRPYLGNSLKASLSLITNSVLVRAVSMIISISLRFMRLHDLAISIAVSYLSPVRTQILILASIRCLIVSGTSS
jgi:hypothetical protein